MQLVVCCDHADFDNFLSLQFKFFFIFHALSSNGGSFVLLFWLSLCPVVHNLVIFRVKGVCESERVKRERERRERERERERERGRERERERKL